MMRTFAAAFAVLGFLAVAAAPATACPFGTTAEAPAPTPTVGS